MDDLLGLLMEMWKEKGNRIFKTSASSKNDRVSALVSVPGHGCSVYISIILPEPVEAAGRWVSVSCTSDCRRKGGQKVLYLCLPEGTSPRWSSNCQGAQQGPGGELAFGFARQQPWPHGPPITRAHIQENSFQGFWPWCAFQGWTGKGGKDPKGIDWYGLNLLKGLGGSYSDVGRCSQGAKKWKKQVAKPAHSLEGLHQNPLWLVGEGSWSNGAFRFCMI